MASTISVAARLIRNQMRWAGHLIRMDDSRLPKQLFFGELSVGTRPRHKPRMRFRDQVRTNLKRMNLSDDNWQQTCADRDTWRQSIFQGVKSFEEESVARAELRRACRNFEAVPDTPWSCDVCGRVLLSKAGLVNHMKSHQPRPTSTRIHAPVTITVAPTVCKVCGKVCKSPGGLKRHLKIHGNAAPSAVTVVSNHTCHICSLPFRSLAGLKSHLSRHERKRDKNENSETKTRQT